LDNLKKIYEQLRKRDSNEPEFLQAVKEVFDSLEPVAEKYPIFMEAGIFSRIVEPERMIIFRVPWVNDKGEVVCQQRLSRSVQQRHRTVQGRYKIPSVR
jgi:glutamate dehydrogenase (NADP+)